MPFSKGEISNPRGRPKYKYRTLETPWNRKYSRMKAQAKFRKEEFNLTPDEFMQVWEQSGVKEHIGREVYAYCMVRKESIEAWSVDNCIIVPRRMHLRKLGYESLHGYPPTDFEDKHGEGK
tara:strand:+ start:599 stop:961 length:363 start_codon:yes stop_codon:yes gene_type:complete